MNMSQYCMIFDAGKNKKTYVLVKKISPSNPKIIFLLKIKSAYEDLDFGSYRLGDKILLINKDKSVSCYVSISVFSFTLKMAKFEASYTCHGLNRSITVVESGSFLVVP